MSVQQMGTYQLFAGTEQQQAEMPTDRDRCRERHAASRPGLLQLHRM